MSRVEKIGLATLYLGDCREVLPSIRADVFVTDPPYGTGGRRRTGAAQGRVMPGAAVFREEWDNGATDWIALCDATPIITFWPSNRAASLLAAATVLGRSNHRALYMRKRDPMPQPGGRTAYSVEPVWVLSHAGIALHGGDDWFECSTPRMGRDADATGHPYEKPLDCMRWLIGKTRDEVVCDPFMGSGTTGAAAMLEGRQFIGVEQDPQWFDVACRRIEAAQRQTDLFMAPPRAKAATQEALL